MRYGLIGVDLGVLGGQWGEEENIRCFLGSGPIWVENPVEWGEIPPAFSAVCLSIRLSICLPRGGPQTPLASPLTSLAGSQFLGSGSHRGHGPKE